MRVAFVSTVLGYPWGGSDTLWTHAAEHAAAKGDAVFIAVSGLTARSPRVETLHRAGAVLALRERTDGPRTLVRRAASRLRRAGGMPNRWLKHLARFRPDLVIVSCGGTYDLLLEPAFVAWQRATGTPFRVIANFQHENPALEAHDRETITRILRAAERVYFVSHANLAATRRHLLATLPNACVVQNPLRCAAADALPMPAMPPLRLATVGRLEHGKGAALALHAIARALGGTNGWELDIIGSGPDAPYLTATVENLGLTRQVRLRGFVSSLAEIWRDHHLLLSPSLDDGVPMTIPEAMLLGRPVLATRVGGAPDWIKHERNGFLCPAPTVSLLAETISGAWQQRDRWAELGRQAAADAAAAYRPRDFEQLVAP